MKKVGKERINWPVTILLIAGLITVVFPLYMTVVIALKKPSEMTNDVAGILSLPKHFSLSNFTEAMKVTDFWNSLGNSLLITVVTVVLAMLIHSLLGYAIARNKAHSKFYKFIYFYVVSGMFVPFAILMMPVVKQTAQMGRSDHLISGILYADECAAVFRISDKYSQSAGRGSMRGWSKYMDNLLEDHLSDHETNACNGCGSDSTWNMERCYDTIGYYVRHRKEHTAAGTA